MRINASASLLAIALFGCGSSENPLANGGDDKTNQERLCIPGQQLTCACPGGESGAQACREDGSGFLACDCTGQGGNGDNDAGTGADAGKDSGSHDGDGGTDADASKDGDTDSGSDDAGKDDGNDGGADGGGTICTEISREAESLPLDIYVMLDKSGSMAWDNSGNMLSGGASNPNSRWYQVTSALKAFAVDPTTTGLGMGLGYFPGSPECSANTYKAPAVSIGLLPMKASAIQASLDSTSPVGGTPTRYALEGALQYAKEWSNAQPNHTVIVVLATDGEPSGCTGNSMTNIKDVASSYATQGIKTFVIGIGNQTGNLNEIAAAGGTDEAIMVIGSNAQQQFIDAMSEIRTAARPCEYALPAPRPGKPLDYDAVGLRFHAGNGSRSDIPYLEDAARCGLGGWFYDDASAPTKLLVCPETCDVFKADEEGQVNVVLGCEGREI